MLALRNSVWLIALCIGLWGCGEESKADPSDIFGGAGGSSSPSATTFCSAYCTAMVENGDGCERYNDDQRCERICRFYVASGCQTTYEPFAECMRTSDSASCVDSGNGKLALVVSGCNQEFETWIQCRDEKDAGVCPY